MPEIDLEKEHPRTEYRMLSQNEIRYFLVGDEEPIGFDVPRQLRSGAMRLLGLCPKNAIQVLNPLAYHRFHIERDLSQSLFFGVIFAANFHRWASGLMAEPALLHVLFWETEDASAIEALKRIEGNVVVFPTKPEIRSRLETSGVDLKRMVATHGDMLRQIEDRILEQFKMDRPAFERAGELVRESAERFHADLYSRKALPFSPMHTNLEQIGQLLGQFREDYWENPPNDPNARPAALGDSFDAVRNLVCSITNFETDGHSFARRFPSAILAFPTISPQLREQFRRNLRLLDPDLQAGARDLMETRFSEQDSTTYLNGGIRISGGNVPASFAGLKELGEYSHFFDRLGYLHGSFEIGPYMRAPVKGASFASEMSFFAPRNFAAHAPEKSIAKRVRRFGVSLAKAVHPRLRKSLVEYPGGVVGISDLPLEWMDLDGVPLCFSKDVCRIPETVITNVMSHFARNVRSGFQITSETPKRTLVICGAPEADPVSVNFAILKEVQEQHGIESRLERCQSLDHFCKLVNEFRPEFLVIDSHGRFVANETGTELMIGGQQLTGSDVIERLPQIPIVMLSACWGAPLYGCANTIAHAFFEAGSYVVTTSFLPLNVAKGGLLYTRVVRNLQYAAEHAVHPNWASFLSHNVRTAYFSDLYDLAVEKIGREGVAKEAYVEKRQTWQFNSMIPERRAATFHATEKVVAGCFPEAMRERVHNLLRAKAYRPEFMFYTTLGRADLVKFAAWRHEHHLPVQASVEVKDILAAGR
jgi:hypothetical protein